MSLGGLFSPSPNKTIDTPPGTVKNGNTEHERASPRAHQRDESILLSCRLQKVVLSPFPKWLTSKNGSGWTRHIASRRSVRKTRRVSERIYH